MSKYEVFSGPYFAIFGLNREKYGPEKTPYLDIPHAQKKVKMNSEAYSELCQASQIERFEFCISALS